jgi:hypothetical protein
MKVAEDTAMDSESAVIAFASNGTKNPHSFIITNINKEDQKIVVRVIGSEAMAFEAFRTAKSPGSELDEIQEKYKFFGSFEVNYGMMEFDSPAGSVTTFFSFQ